MLAIVIKRAKEYAQVEGLIPHLVDGGVSVLQYTNDTIIFMENDLDKALNMKLIVYFFEQLSGLKIIFHRSKIYYSIRIKNCGRVTRSSLDVT
jgi:hypothetical protein